MKKLFLLISIIASFAARAQVETTISLPYYNSGNGGTLHALLYNVGTTPGKKYPLFIFLHGSGEAGTNLAQIYNNATSGGIPYLIEHGLWTPGIHNFATGQPDTAIVVSPQTNNNWSSSGPDVNGYINYMVANYNVDINRITVFGLSSGGGGAVEAAARMDGNENNFNFPLTYKLAAIVPMSLATLTPLQSWANVIVGDGVHAWGHGDPNNDTYGENTQSLMGYMNNAQAGYARFSANTFWHGGWNQRFDPTYRETITVGSVTASMNIYEWAVLFTRQTNTPTASAGSNQSITQPATTCTLNGTASVAGPGHSLAGYAWSKTSGPACTITSPSSATTGVTGMTTAGSYVFQITVTDNASQTSSASVTVTVVSDLPTADAGTNHTITLPTTSVSLIGTPTVGPGRSLSSVGWTKVSGPNAPTITSPSSNNTTVTGLIIGTYVFRFTVTDDLSQTATSDNTTVVIASSYSPPDITVSGNQTITLPTSSVSLTSTATANGSSIVATKWTKLSVPGVHKYRVVGIGSSYMANYGPDHPDSAFMGGWDGTTITKGRFNAHYSALGIIDTVFDLGSTGTNVYQAMPNGNVPSTSIQAKLSPSDSPHVATNITAALALHPDVIIVGFPTNGYDVFTISEAMAPFRAIYALCVANSVQCYIMTTAPRTDATFNTQAKRDFLKQVADSIVAEFPGHAIDIHLALTATGTTNPIYPTTAGDSIHMNDAGGGVMYNDMHGTNVFQNLISSASTITTPTSANTTITGLTAGVHKFQVSSFDAHGQAAVGEVTITVNTSGTATANAGPPQTIVLPTSSATLDGSGSSGATTYSWTQKGGPNTATITGQTAVVATVSGLIQGVYTFQLSINSGASTSQVVVTVSPTPPVPPCKGAVYTINPDGTDSSVYDQSGIYSPGDTLRINGATSTVDFGNLQGRTGCPIVIINKPAGQILVTKHIDLLDCQYVKITGSGSNNQYGFLIQQDPRLRQQSDPGINLQGHTSNIEIERVQMHNVDIGIVAENNEDCDVTLNYPYQWDDSLNIHDNKIVGTWNEGMYIGNTSPDNASYDLRPLTCNGITTYPAPSKNGYAHIYNNIVDSTGRGGIQVSNAINGVSEIANNTVSHTGMNGDDAQGSAIVIGLYTKAYIHDNTISCTYTWGIASIGAGATNTPVRIENNHIDSSGYLRAYDLATTSRTIYDPATEPLAAALLTWPQAIEIDTRQRLYTTDTPNPGTAVHGQDSTVFSVKNNTIGITKGNVGLNVDDDGAGLQKNGHVICNNLNKNGSPAVIVVNPPINFSTNCAVAAIPCQCLQSPIPFKLH